MIDLGRPALHARGVTLFPDHADPGLFHYLPDRPRLRQTDGVPELSLLRYRLDPELEGALGGGLLSLTVDLAVEDELLDLLRAQVRRHRDTPGTVRLTPVAPRAGRCKLVLVDRDSQSDAPSALVQRILGDGQPALFGTNACTFLAVLSPEAAALVEGALRQGGLPAGVVYALETPVLCPALRARVRARWQDVYDFFEARMRGGRILLAVDVGPTLEDLVRAEVLDIEVDQLVPEAERAEVFHKAVERVQRYVLDEFFEPVLGQRPPAPDEGDGGVLDLVHDAVVAVVDAFSFTFSLRQVERQEDKRFDFDLAAATAELLTLSPQGTLAALLPDLDADEVVTDVEAGPDPALVFDVGTPVDLDALGIDRVEVAVEHGGQRSTLVLDAATPARPFHAWYDRDGDEDRLRYTATVHFEAGTPGLAGPLTGEPAETSARVIRVDPRHLYEEVELQAVARGVPFDSFPAVLVDLRASLLPAGETFAETLELSAASPSARWSVRAARGQESRLSARLRYVGAGGAEVRREWRDVAPGFLVVGEPYPAVLDVAVLASARFGTHVARVVVELRTLERPERVSTFVLDAGTPYATWSVPLDDPERRRWEYRVTLHTVQSEVREGEWTPGEGGRLQVGENIWQVREVELLFLGLDLARRGLLGVKVRFSYDDDEHGIHEEQEHLVTDPRAPLAWSYPVADPERRAFRYELTLVHATGEQERLDPVETADKLVLCAL